jgi:hypothetical protein
MKKHRIEFSATLYSPEQLIDKLCTATGARSYSALSRAIDVSPSVLSKVRHRRLAVSGEILLRMHESTGIPIRELRRWMGDNRRYFSPLPPSQLTLPVESEPDASDEARSTGTRASRFFAAALMAGVR